MVVYKASHQAVNVVHMNLGWLAPFMLESQQARSPSGAQRAWFFFVIVR